MFRRLGRRPRALLSSGLRRGCSRWPTAAGKPAATAAAPAPGKARPDLRGSYPPRASATGKPSVPGARTAASGRPPASALGARQAGLARCNAQPTGRSGKSRSAACSLRADAGLSSTGLDVSRAWKPREYRQDALDFQVQARRDRVSSLKDRERRFLTAIETEIHS